MRVHHQPCEFNARQREWVAKEIDELVRCGVVCRAEKVRCAANLVLVGVQQSGQSYRACCYTIDINAQSCAVDYPFAQQQDMLDSCAGARCLFAMDIKAGYHNVRCTPCTSDVLGIVTQDGLFKWIRMPFGPQQAPAYYQYIMDTVLHGIEGVRFYLDDLKTQGNSWQQCWAATINVFRALTAAGFKINLQKCKLLVHKCTLLGCLVSKSQIALGDKYLRGLVGLQVTTT